MDESLLIGLGSIIVLGVIAQWVAWKIHIPSILLLLVFGFAAGPLLGQLNPDAVFGDLLFPLVSISVGIILFEGGLSLKFSELKQVGGVVFRLVSVAVIVTWVLGAVSVHFITGMPIAPAVLLGAVLVVSGPTVIIPLLRDIRPSKRIASVIKWEGIVNDPIGAILAVLVFQVIAAGGMEFGVPVVAWGVFKAIFLGGLAGLVGAALIIILLKKFLIPDFLQNPFSLMIVVVVYGVSNHFQAESGLLAVTLMGITLANQKYVPIKHIIDFKENLRVLIISSLFIILAARITSDQLALFNARNWLFVAGLILVVRPLAVLASTLGSSLKRNERLFLCWMAPRGIVAAAVSSVFAIKLIDAGYLESSSIVPLTFQVIIGTVAVYGLTAKPVARKLKVAVPNPQGILFAGAQPFVRELATILEEQNFRTLLVDTNRTNVRAARRAGLKAVYGNILSENLLAELDLEGIGKLFAMTPNDEVNSLSSLHFLDVFGQSEVYQLTVEANGNSNGADTMPSYMRGRLLFDERADYDYLMNRRLAGSVVKRTTMTEQYGLEDLIKRYGDSVLPLLVITDSGELRVFTVDAEPSIKPGSVLISIIDPENERDGDGDSDRRPDAK